MKRQAEWVVFMLFATALLLMCLQQCGCTNETIQSAQVAPLQATPDPRHEMTYRKYTTWCGLDCLSVVTVTTDSAPIVAWNPLPDPPNFPYDNPATRTPPAIICAPRAEATP